MNSNYLYNVYTTVLMHIFSADTHIHDNVQITKEQYNNQ